MRLHRNPNSALQEMQLRSASLPSLLKTPPSARGPRSMGVSRSACRMSFRAHRWATVPALDLFKGMSVQSLGETCNFVQHAALCLNFYQTSTEKTHKTNPTDKTFPAQNCPNGRTHFWKVDAPQQEHDGRAHVDVWAKKVFHEHCTRKNMRICLSIQS